MGFKHDDPCIKAAADDEPLFVLRANDELAPDIVIFWANAYLRKHTNAGTMTEVRLAKYAEAVETAGKMEDWKRKKNGLDK